MNNCFAGGALARTARAAKVPVFDKIALGVIQQDLLAFAFVKNFAGIQVVTVAFLLFREHFVQEVSVIVFQMVARVNRRWVVLDHFFVVVLNQLMATLGD